MQVAIAFALAVPTPLLAQPTTAPAPAPANPPGQPAARATAPLELAEDAPDKHVVVKGDTLWDISGKFLTKPWRWPEIWQLNRDQIRNPHLIYPGDIVYLDRSGPQPRLRLGRAVGAGAGGSGTEGADGLRTERLSPQVRVEALAKAAIPTVPASLIEPFLNRPLIVEENQLRSSARVLAAPEARVYMGKGDVVYARGISDMSIPEWHVYRPARPILHPDTRLPLAHEALYIGTARLEKAGDVSTLRIVSAAEEIGEGDRLMPALEERPVSFVPRPPEKELSGRIVSIHRGVRQVGRNGVVAISMGRGQGIEVGNVMSIQATGRVVPDREAVEQRRQAWQLPSIKATNVQLPAVDIGHLLVFRVFDTISYGLVMNASRAIEIGDAVVTP